MSSHQLPVASLPFECPVVSGQWENPSLALTETFEHAKWRPATDNRRLATVIPASRLGDRPRPAMAASGVAAVDTLTGGLPRGALTEICGAASSGRTSLLLAAMAQASARGEVIALVDTSDSFDPASAEAAGVELKKVLWVRCAQQGRMSNAECRMKSGQWPVLSGRRQSQIRNQNSQIYGPIEQALKVTDLLLQAGGFGMVIVDLGDIPEPAARRVPLASWFRFRRAVEHTDTVLVALTREACAKSCASVVLRLKADGRRLDTGGQWSVASGQSIGNRKSAVGNEVTHARLMGGLEVRAEVLRDAVQGKKPVQSAARFAAATEWKRRIG